MKSVTNARWGKWTTKFDTSNLLGEIVVVDVSELCIAADVMAQAAIDCGLSEAIRKVSRPDALRRVVSQLKRRQPVFLIKDDKDNIAYQISRAAVENGVESFTGSKVSVVDEGQVVMEKSTGKVTASSPELAQSMTDLVDFEVAHRRTHDVSSFVSKVFRNNADLFKLKSTGGAYFVPSIHSGVCDSVGCFLAKCQSALRRYPVAKGKLTGDRDIRDAVEDGLKGMIAEAEVAVQNFLQDDLEPSKLKARNEELELIEFKLECYKDYLADKAESLKGEVKKLRSSVKQAILSFIDGGEGEMPINERGVSEETEVVNESDEDEEEAEEGVDQPASA